MGLDTGRDDYLVSGCLADSVIGDRRIAKSRHPFVWCNLQITICRCKLLMHVQMAEMKPYSDRPCRPRHSA